MPLHYGTRVDFQVLGPVAARNGETEVELGGPKQRLVLAILIAAQGATVSTDALMDGLWMDAPPATARKTLQGYVHHLRAEVGEAIETQKSGYSLHVPDSAVDERRFTTNAKNARPLIETDPVKASDLLAGALALWRGHPYADLAGAPVLLPEISRLGEARLTALGDRMDADLALGRHEALVGELESLTVEHPLLERFSAQLMLALYRSGRHGEALRVYVRTRNLFIDEMGVEPSPHLAALESRMLARDQSLDLPTAQGSTVRAVRGFELRERVAAGSGFAVHRGYQRSVGREVAIRLITGDAANNPEFIARHQSDVARIAALDHPSIVSVNDSWREPGSVFQVMQWVEGERLDVLLEAGPLGVPAGLRVLEDVGTALGVAHRAGVVHGAVDANAVLIATETGNAHLTDFVIGRDPGHEREDWVAFAALAVRVIVGDAGAGERLRFCELFDAVGREPVRPEELVRALRREIGGDVVQLATTQPVEGSHVRCPYKGLQAFQRADEADFFGRDDLVSRVLRTVGRQRLVAVVGPSGSGKSSMVKAGLVPRLAGDARTQLLAEMYPGRYPFEALEKALRTVAVTDATFGDRLLADERGLLRVADAILPDGDAELLLVIDQFEELFAMVAAESVRSLFLDNLVAAVTDKGSRVRVVLTLRADFFDRPLRYAAFGSLVEAGLVTVSMPGDADLTAAIECPARAVGVEVEPGLAREILRDVADEPGALPLVQYALTELFEARQGDMLTLEAYRATGGVLGALGARAETLYTDLAAPGRRAMQQAFLRLVSVESGDGSVRRRVTRADLAALEVDGAALEEGLRTYGAHRLLTFDADPVSRAPTVEVAHEALLREWERLRGWIEAERDQLVVRRRLDAALVEWSESGEHPSYLLRGQRLTQFDAWATGTDMALSSSERSFLQASREHDDHLARTARVRRHRVMAALIAATLIAVGFGVFALMQRNDAADEARDAETARLAGQAGFVVERDRQMALLMAVEAFRRDPGFEGLSALQRVLVDAGPYLGTLGAGISYTDVHWVTADRVLASTGTELHVFELGKDASVISASVVGELPIILAASPGGVAAVAGPAGDVQLVDVASGAVERFLAADGASAMAISPDSTRVAIGRPDGSVEVVERASGAIVASALVNPPRSAAELTLDPAVVVDAEVVDDLAGVTGLAFDKGGDRLLTAGGVFIRAWNAADLTPVGPEIVHSWGPDEFNLGAANPRWLWLDGTDDDVAVVAGDEYEVRWRVSTGERVSLRTLPVTVASASGTGGGESLVLTDDGRVFKVGVDVELALDAQEGEVATVSVGPSGHRFAVATGDGLVTGSLDGTRLLARSVAIGTSTRPTLDRTGRTLAAGLVSDGLFRLDSGPPVRRSFDVDVEIAQFAGSPATFELTSGGDVDLLLWTSTFMEMRNAYELDSGEYAGDFWGSFFPAWSDDGGRVVTVDRNGATVIEEVETGAELYRAPLAVSTADFDHTGARVVLVTLDRESARVVELDSGTETEVPSPPGGVVAASFSSDGDMLVVIGGRGAVHLVDAHSFELRRELEEADVSSSTIALPPVLTDDGRWLFSAADGVARLWHLDSGRQLGKPFPSDPDGRPFGVADRDLLRLVTPVAGDALVWNLDTTSWPALACRAAGRNMTESEWATFGPRDTEYRPTCPNLQ